MKPAKATLVAQGILYKGGTSKLLRREKRLHDGPFVSATIDSERPANAKRFKSNGITDRALLSPAERCKLPLSQVQQEQVLVGSRLIRKRQPRAVVVLDQDCFYAQTLLNKPENKMYKNQPFGVTQKYLVVTCNYPARAKGVGKLMSIEEAKSKCPGLVLRCGEDLTVFREASCHIYNAAKDFFMRYIKSLVSQRGDSGGSEDEAEDLPSLSAHTEESAHALFPSFEKSGLDELYIDCTALASFILRTPMDRADSFESFHLPGAHILGNFLSRGVAPVYGGQETNHLLNCTTEIAFNLRKHISCVTGYECCAGIACNKLVAKLAVNMYKPNQQTTIFPEAVVPCMLDMPVGYICGIGRQMAQRLNDIFKITTVRNALDFQIDLCSFEREFGDRVGRFLFLAFRGIDEAEVKEEGAPKTVGVEDSMLGVCSIHDVNAYLEALSCDLFQRLKADQKTYSRRPLNLVLKIRHASAGRISKQAPLPVHMSTPNDLLDISKRLFKTVVDASQEFKLTLIGISVKGFKPLGKGRKSLQSGTISDSFRRSALSKSKGNIKRSHGAAISAQVVDLREASDMEKIDIEVFHELPKDLQQEILEDERRRAQRNKEQKLSKKSSLKHYFTTKSSSTPNKK